MKTKTTYLSSALAAVLLLIATTQSYATINYTISFTASGATNFVGSVQVQNLTKSTTVTVPNGNTLTLTDLSTAVDAHLVSTMAAFVFRKTEAPEHLLLHFMSVKPVTQKWLRIPLMAEK